MQKNYKTPLLTPYIMMRWISYNIVVFEKPIRKAKDAKKSKLNIRKY